MIETPEQFERAEEAIAKIKRFLCAVRWLTCSVSDPVFTGAKIGARIRPARPGVQNVSTTIISPWPKNRLGDRKQS